MAKREEDCLELFSKHKAYEEKILCDVIQRMYTNKDKKKADKMFKPIVDLQHQMNRELTRFGFELFKMELDEEKKIQDNLLGFDVLPTIQE